MTQRYTPCSGSGERVRLTEVEAALCWTRCRRCGLDVSVKHEQSPYTRPTVCVPRHKSRRQTQP